MEKSNFEYENDDENYESDFEEDCENDLDKGNDDYFFTGEEVCEDDISIAVRYLVWVKHELDRCMTTVEKLEQKQNTDFHEIYDKITTFIQSNCKHEYNNCGDVCVVCKELIPYDNHARGWG